MLHPGPSLLVTATFVAIAGRAAGMVPSAGKAVQLVAIMLPVQFAIGAANDAADARNDATAKPYKPIVRGVVNQRAAGVAAAVLGAGGLVAAATVNPPTLGLVVAGLAAGLAYDFGLRRTPLSWVPWWGGIALLPLAAYTATGSFPSQLLMVIPASLLAGVSLHCANALPDIDADRRAGRRSLPVLLGETLSRAVAMCGLAGAAIVAVGAALAWGSAARWIVLGAGVVFAAVLGVVAVRRLARPFPLLAVATACFAFVWLAALPA